MELINKSDIGAALKDFAVLYFLDVSSSCTVAEVLEGRY
jgi:hypothetical protein